MSEPRQPDVWDPARYERFRAERSQPFHDLLGLVRPLPGGRAAAEAAPPPEPMNRTSRSARSARPRVIDLGCGTGELTRLLHERTGARETVGVDRSPAMLERALRLDVSGLRFERRDLADCAGLGRFDLVFSNAALQWAPDHEALLERLTRDLVAPGGQLAVQMPANHDGPTHVVAAEVAAEAPFREALAGYRRESPVLGAERYAVLLDRLGYAPQHVRLQVYAHRLDGPEAAVEWVRGTLLTAYEERLPAPLFEQFLARYRERLFPRLGESRPIFFPYPRLLLWGSR